MQFALGKSLVFAFVSGHWKGSACELCEVVSAGLAEPGFDLTRELAECKSWHCTAEASFLLTISPERLLMPPAFPLHIPLPRLHITSGVSSPSSVSL